jgi:hypothetical protein
LLSIPPRKSPSAMGLRQVFPVQTKSTFNGAADMANPMPPLGAQSIRTEPHTLDELPKGPLL